MAEPGGGETQSTNTFSSVKEAFTKGKQTLEKTVVQTRLSPFQNKLRYMMLRIFSERFGHAAEQRIELKEKLRFIKDEYGFTPEMHRLVKNDPEQISRLEKLSLPEAITASTILIEELAKYPSDYIRSLKIKQYRIVKKFHENIPIGDAVKEHEVQGIISPDGIIFSSLSDDPNDFRKSIHHELLHMSDFTSLSNADKRVVLIMRGKQPIDESTFDTEWSELNSENANVYSEQDALQLMQNHPGNRPRGFAEIYGITNPQEDRATISHNLFTNPHDLFMKAAKDEDLKRKILSLAETWSHRTNNRINFQFFKYLGRSTTESPDWYTQQQAEIARLPKAA